MSLIFERKTFRGNSKREWKKELRRGISICSLYSWNSSVFPKKILMKNGIEKRNENVKFHFILRIRVRYVKNVSLKQGKCYKKGRILFRPVFRIT